MKKWTLKCLSISYEKRISTLMGYLRQIQSFFHICVIQSLTCSLNRNVPFFKAPVFDNIHEEGILLPGLIMGSKLACGAKCTEFLGQCLSYAWNKRTANCLLFSQKVNTNLSSAIIEGDLEFYNIRACSPDLENGVLDVNKALFPGDTVNGSCNHGYIAISGDILATCNSESHMILSDRCRLLLTNVAVGKPAVQSSTFQTDDAAKAVDGDRGTDIIENTCSHTDTGDDNPWWRVDLLDNYYILTVRIVNRGLDFYGIGRSTVVAIHGKMYDHLLLWDSEPWHETAFESLSSHLHENDESARLKDVTVSTGITLSNITSFCGFFAGPGVLSQLVTINCPQYTMGRYVQISLVTPYLTLCEVDVFVVDI